LFHIAIIGLSWAINLIVCAVTLITKSLFETMGLYLVFAPMKNTIVNLSKRIELPSGM